MLLIGHCVFAQNNLRMKFWFSAQKIIWKRNIYIFSPEKSKFQLYDFFFFFFFYWQLNPKIMSSAGFNLVLLFFSFVLFNHISSVWH